MRPLALALALLLAGSASAANINYAYQVTGDAQARPVQAFDDGRQLFIQLRDPRDPPAPIGPSGPIAYQMRGPYIVLPLMSSVLLQYGPYQARVLANGAADAAPGVVSVTRPVEVTESTGVATAAPSSRYVPPALAPVAAMAPSNVVTGEIVAVGPSGTKRADLPTTGANTARSGDYEERTVSFEDATKRSAFDGLRARSLVLRADGSTAGARAVLAARSACTSAGARCQIDYKGAPAGKILIVEKNG